MSDALRIRLGMVGIVLLVASWLATPSAQLASSPPEALIRSMEYPPRVASQKVEEVVARLGLTPGLVVADIGSGTGVFSRPIARAVGPTGKVYAIDIMPEVLDYQRERNKTEGISNIEPVLGIPDDPKLPKADVDLAFFNDVVHHIEHRPEYMKALAKYMKPASRMAVVEFYTSIEGTPVVLRADLDRFVLDAGGFLPVQEFPELFAFKWYVIYERKP